MWKTKDNENQEFSHVARRFCLRCFVQLLRENIVRIIIWKSRGSERPAAGTTKFAELRQDELRNHCGILINGKTINWPLRTRTAKAQALKYHTTNCSGQCSTDRNTQQAQHTPSAPHCVCHAAYDLPVSDRNYTGSIAWTFVLERIVIYFIMWIKYIRFSNVIVVG